MHNGKKMAANLILEIKNLHKSFGNNTLHNNLSFNLKEGECLGILGPSGTGKSVLLRSIIGLEHIDSGEIYFQGHRIDDLTERMLFKIRTQVSYAFQSGALFDSMTVYDNLAYPLYEHTTDSEEVVAQKIKETLSIVGLEGRENLMPSDLSGGMQKRVGLARAIILNPAIVLYDEPTAGLDPLNIDKVVGILSKLKKSGFSSIFVTHDIPAAIAVCDRIIILGGGGIIFEGTPHDMEMSESKQVQDFFVMERKHTG